MQRKSFPTVLNRNFVNRRESAENNALFMQTYDCGDGLTQVNPSLEHQDGVALPSEGQQICDDAQHT